MNPTPEQRAAISSTARDILVLACPGAGKTATLIERIAAMSEGDQMSTIVVTFTNKAAAQLRHKLEQREIRVHFVGTLHGLAARILLVIGQRPAIISQEQQDAVLKELITSMRSKASLKGVKACLYGMPGPKEEAVVAAYRKRLRDNDAFDYDGLLTAAAQAAHLYNHRRWHLFVDEYQDSGAVDDQIYDALPCASRFWVGDADQGIYSFRGATRANLLRRMASVTVLRLTTNFRSGERIVATANQILKDDRYHQTMVAARPGCDNVRIDFFSSHHAELSHLIQRIAHEAREGKEWAVLTRYNTNRREIEEGLRAAGAPLPAPPIPRSSDQRIVEAWLALQQSPNSRMAQAQYFRAVQPPTNAQRSIEIGKSPDVQIAPIRDWPDLCDRLKRLGISQGTILRTFTAWSDAGSEPGDILVALREEPPVEKVKGAVTVTTLHGAKGLEFDSVWLPALEDIRENNLEEERRLFYVGATRAINTLVMSAAATRPNAYTGMMERPKPSPFLLELAESAS